MVSVFVLTYNQEQFIAQTLTSLVKQQTTFPYTIVIGDDASTDKTTEICKKFKNRYPQKIVHIVNQTNQGLIKNFMTTAKSLHGKYVAVCDGDDYWIDDKKLQKQVGFLENNPEFVLVGTQVKRMDATGEMSSPKVTSLQEYSVKDMILDNRIVAPTALFRNFNALKNLPFWFEEIPYGDWPVYLLLLGVRPGKVAVLPDVTAVYRTQIGASARIRENLSDLFSIKSYILKNLLHEPIMQKHSKMLKKSLFQTKLNQMSALNRQKAFYRAFAIFSKAFFQKPSAELLRRYSYSLYKSIKSAS